jgi:demethylmenaquinone methyltransferase / 2-methoxy-6-polyprenyl-1,4-benzoquinol methylase
MEVENKTAINKPLHGMFSDVPPRYDLINSVITWNMDKGWRRLAAEACLKGRPMRVLDLCCGTGDLAINLAEMADYPLEIEALDYSQPMLLRAGLKAARVKMKAPVKFVQGEADRLPFPSGYFDCLGISFAFRNLTYKNPLVKVHLSEIARVLKKGGRFVIVESSQPRNFLIRAGYHLYLRQFVAHAGNWISGNRGAYQYLAESASRYYTPAEIEGLLRKSGFESVTYRPLFLGAAGLHVAVR